MIWMSFERQASACENKEVSVRRPDPATKVLLITTPAVEDVASIVSCSPGDNSKYPGNIS